MDWEHSGLPEYPSGDEDSWETEADEQDAYDEWEGEQYEDEEPEESDDFPMYLEYDDWKYDYSGDIDSYNYENPY